MHQNLDQINPPSTTDRVNIKHKTLGWFLYFSWQEPVSGTNASVFHRTSNHWKGYWHKHIKPWFYPNGICFFQALHWCWLLLKETELNAISCFRGMSSGKKITKVSLFLSKELLAVEYFWYLLRKRFSFDGNNWQFKANLKLDSNTFHTENDMTGMEIVRNWKERFYLGLFWKLRIGYQYDPSVNQKPFPIKIAHAIHRSKRNFMLINF